MDLLIANITLILFVLGNFFGLEYSYKFPPYNIKNIDKYALLSSILGAILLNTPLFYIGAFFIGFPLGMRSGYGRIEFLVGIILFLIIRVVVYGY
ncbi:energy-converting hydrogenase subunit EhaL family protein [Methanocaldococcus indicus]|uniref:energy-converting hydrogenase subunit EhaL family protein n=1 Tax=Methanocaldococcus indicus TaxID=213231 RepID=UPI003C6CF7A1